MAVKLSRMDSGKPKKAKSTFNDRPTVVSSNKPSTAPQIKQKAVPPVFTSLGGSAGLANSVVEQTAANPTNGPTPFAAGGGGGVPGTPMTGAGARFGYTPEGLMGLYANPVPLAEDVLAQYGVDNYGFAQLLADAFNPALYAHMLGTGGLGDQSDAAVIDYIANYLTQMTTPGGSVPHPNDLLGLVMGMGDVDNLLESSIARLPADQQPDAINNFLMAATYGMNPLAQQMYRRFAEQAASDYATSQFHGPKDVGSNYADFLRREFAARGGRY